MVGWCTAGWEITARPKGEKKGDWGNWSHEKKRKDDPVEASGGEWQREVAG